MSITFSEAIGSNNAGRAGSAPASRGSAMDMSAFLTLFTTQLKYQDPTNPLESYELAAQLAQFSTVERLTEANKSLEVMRSHLSSMNNSLMVQMLGKQITALGNALITTDGEVSQASYEIDRPCEVKIEIHDESGQLVRTLHVGAQDAGSYEVAWDGCDDSGNKVADGAYSFQVEAVDQEGNTVDVLTTISGVCRAVHMGGGVVYLTLGGPDGVDVTPGSVIEVCEANVV